MFQQFKLEDFEDFSYDMVPSQVSIYVNVLGETFVIKLHLTTVHTNYSPIRLAYIKLSYNCTSKMDYH